MPDRLQKIIGYRCPCSGKVTKELIPGTICPHCWTFVNIPIWAKVAQPKGDPKMDKKPVNVLDNQKTDDKPKALDAAGKYALILRFNKMLEDIGKGWTITIGEIYQIKEQMGLIDSETREVLEKMLVASLRGKSTLVYQSSDNGVFVRQDCLALVELFSSRPTERLHDIVDG